MKHLELKLDIDPCLQNQDIISDQSRIKQALLNLLSNAFKFTFDGWIKISIHSEIGLPRGANVSLSNSREKKYIKISVEDTGIGIGLKDQKCLFKLFGKVSKSKLKNPSGCGIGLTVTKRYIEHLEGHIELKSKPEKGTCVNIWIPHIQVPCEQTLVRLDNCNVTLNKCNELQNHASSLDSLMSK